MRIWTVSRMASQLSRTAPSAVSAASTLPCRRTRSRTSSTSFPWPRRNTRRRVSPGCERHGDVQRRAGIEPRPEAARQRLTPKSRRLRERAVAAEERRAVAGRRAQRLARVGEGDAPRELLVVGVPGQDRAGRGVELGHDVACPGPPAAARAPTRCRRRRSGGGAVSLSFVSVSRENFTGSFASTKTSRSWRMPCAARAKRVSPAECRITKRPSVPVRGIGPGVGDHVSPVSSSRTKSASAVGSAHGVVREGREAVLAAVLRPGVGRPRGRDHRPERRGWR